MSLDEIFHDKVVVSILSNKFMRLHIVCVICNQYLVNKKICGYKNQLLIDCCQRELRHQNNRNICVQ